MVERKRIADVLTEDEHEHEFLRSVVLPVEDQLKYFNQQPEHGYRWFKSKNVIDLAKVQRLKLAGRV